MAGIRLTLDGIQSWSLVNIAHERYEFVSQLNNCQPQGRPCTTKLLYFILLIFLISSILLRKRFVDFLNP